MSEILKYTLSVVIGPAISGVIGYFIIDAIVKRISNTKEVAAGCEKHDIFLKLESLKIRNIETNFKLSSEGKELVFKNILISQVDCVLEEVHMIVEDITEDTKKYEDQTNMQVRLIKGLDRIFSKFNTFYENDHRYTDDDKKTIKIVMDKFIKLNKERVDLLYDGVLEVNSSIFYRTPDEKVCAFFDIIVSLVRDQLINSEATFSRINGDLKGLSFKGVIIK